MKLDLTRLPVGGMLVGFILAMVVVTFVGAFIAVGGDEEGGELVSGSPTATPGAPTPGGSPSGGVVEVKMIPVIKFNVSEMTVPANSQVTVRANNQDSGVFHNWAAYTDSSATEKIAGTELCTAPCVKDVTFTAPGPGEYFFRCDVHPTQMIGKLIAQ